VQVVVTSVTTNSDGETIVSFVVTGLDAEDLAAVSDAVESGPFAEEVTPSHPHTHTPRALYCFDRPASTLLLLLLLLLSRTPQ
jgi:hypothetical protein